MAEKKNGILSKIITGGFTLLLVVLMVFVFIYLAFVPDFVAPISFQIDSEAYDYSIDEFAEFLKENDYITTADYQTTTVNVEGVDEARRYGDCYVLYWDTQNMDTDSVAYTDWKRYSNVGNLTLDDGTRIIVYACFGVSYQETESKTPSYAFLKNFPSAYSGKHSSDTVWDYTFDEFIDYLQDCGFVNADDWKLMSTVGTINRIYNGIDIIWWDVDNLEEGTDAYKYWHEFQENGYIIFGTAIYVPQFNGPFAVYANTSFSGSSSELYEALENFPKNYTKKHKEKTVWDYTFEEFEDYMVQLGYFTKGDYKEMSTIGTISRIYNGIDVMWWDVEHLEEDTKPYKYWYEFQEEGYTLDFGNTVYIPTFNGPFAIKATTAFPGNASKLYEDFAAFPQNYIPSTSS